MITQQPRVKKFSKKHRELLALGMGTTGNEPKKEKRRKNEARITVVVRKRPLTNVECSKLDADILATPSPVTITVEEPRKSVSGQPYIEKHPFQFDRVYDLEHSNTDVYLSCVRPLVDAVFQEGGRCSCFAYGQTGSGKTYTMIGPHKLRRAPVTANSIGVWEQAGDDVFRWLRKPAWEYTYGLHASFFEIYCNKVYDLLNQRNLVRALESNTADGVVVRDLVQQKLEDMNQFRSVIAQGNEQRITGTNSKNIDSSRGHAIFSLEIRDEHQGSTYGKLVFVDLAGSERGADTIFAQRQTQQDGAGINRSLLALKECIRALDVQNAHIPFRNTELTKVLRDMFIGPKARTVMISNVSPASSCCEQTLNTLRYASLVFSMRRNCKPDIADRAEPAEEFCEAEESSDAVSSPCSSPREMRSRPQRSDLGDIAHAVAEDASARRMRKHRNSTVSLGTSHMSGDDETRSDCSERREASGRKRDQWRHTPSATKVLTTTPQSSHGKSRAENSRPSGGAQLGGGISRNSKLPVVRSPMIGVAPRSVQRRRTHQRETETAERPEGSRAKKVPGKLANAENAPKARIQRMENNDDIDWMREVRKVFPSSPLDSPRDHRVISLPQLPAFSVEGSSQGEIDEFSMALSARTDELFAHLIQRHHECLQIDIRLNPPQLDLAKNLHRKKKNGKNHVDPRYLSILRKTVEQKLAVYIQLGSTLSLMEDHVVSLDSLSKSNDPTETEEPPDRSRADFDDLTVAAQPPLQVRSGSSDVSPIFRSARRTEN